ncbi:tyrosine-type recombinase/integrase [Rothia terrae]|uniref:tyrosine-type recombinase/integrase n=1 Tax=Rothia terrae TaxID=396015 RepID=UPI0033EBEB49
MSKRRYGSGSVFKYTQGKTTKWRYKIYEPVDYNDPEGEQRQATKAGFKTAKEAERALREHFHRIEQQLPVANKKITVENYSKQWLDSLRLAPSTIRGYKKIVRNHINPHLGSKDLKKLTPVIINAHYNKLEKAGNRLPGRAGEPLSLNTVKKVHDVLASMLDSAVLDNYLVSNPARHKAVKPPRPKDIQAQKEQMEVWTVQQVKDFLSWDAAQDDDINTLFRIALHTGMRRGEIIALQWRDIDLLAGRVAVMRSVDEDKGANGSVGLPKNGKTRVVDILPGDIQALKEYKAARAAISFEFIKPKALVFGVGADNHMRWGDTVSQRFERATRRAQAAAGDKYPQLSGLPVIPFHNLRHTHATHLLQAGVPAKVVQERLGHKTISITLDVYSHVLPSMQQDAVSRLGAMYA